MLLYNVEAMTNPSALSVDELARLSVQMREADNPEGAQALLIEAVRHQPDEAVLWHCLALAHRSVLDNAAAIPALQRASRLAPQDGKIAHALAHVSLEAGLPAVDLFNRALALRPEDRSVVTGRAAAQFAAGEFAAAIDDLETACRSSPLWIEGHQVLADLKRQCGYGATSTGSYREALASHPHSRPLWLGLLDSNLRVENYQVAQEDLRAADAVLGQVDELEPIRAICASELDDHAEADALFAGLFSQPRYLQNGDLLSRGARHLLRTNRAAAAATLLETGLALPDASKLWPYLATAWRLLDDPRWRALEGDERLIKRIQIYRQDELPRLIQCLHAMHQAAHEPPGQSVRHGSQTDGPLFARIEGPIVDLRHRVVSAVEGYIEELGPIQPGHPTLGHRPRRVSFAGSWSVRLTGAGYHSNHVHPQGWLSSALCIVMPDVAECGPPPAGYLQFGVPPAELGIVLKPTRLIAPEPGWLTLFPSTMWHGTLAIVAGERMSVAFDVKP